MKQAAAPERVFYSVATTRGARGAGFRLLNGPDLFPDGRHVLAPSPGRRGFRNFSETPAFLADPWLGRIERDFEIYGGYWFISDRMKATIEAVDPYGFAFLRCRVQLRDGSEGPIRWLCDAVRVLDAVDEENSDVQILTADDGSKYYRFGGIVRFRSDAVGSAHIFRLKYLEASWACDDELRSACIKAELKGLRFRDVSKPGG
jgi:hypothetical protein